MEEVYCPKVADFAKSTDNGYTSAQIVAMEQQIAKKLQFLLTPPTLCTWANWYMGQWDAYLDTNEFAALHPLLSRLREQRPAAEGDAVTPLRFKAQNELAYARFREVFQVLDAMTLDIQYLQYRPRALVASSLYLVLGLHAGAFEQEEVAANFTRSSAGFLDGEAEEKEAFNDLFIDFLFLSFGFNLAELAPTVMYASQFFGLPFTYDLPAAVSRSGVQDHFEEFLSFQTHHPYLLEFVRSELQESNKHF